MNPEMDMVKAIINRPSPNPNKEQPQKHSCNRLNIWQSINADRNPTARADRIAIRAIR